MGWPDGQPCCETVERQRGRVRIYLPGESVELLSEGWTLTLTPADAFETPSDISATLESLNVSVPSTVAQALEMAGKFDRIAPAALNDRDAWYRLTMISMSAKGQSCASMACRQFRKSSSTAN